MNFNWTDYLIYRAKVRGFDLQKIENILKYSQERYFDIITRSHIVIGKHDDLLVLIAYDKDSDLVTPITIHTITRQQIRFRLKTGRFIYE